MNRRSVQPRLWPVGGLPLAFLDLDGGETKHEAGFSNAPEAEIVVDVVSEFLQKKRGKAVLRPYAKQVSKVRTALRRAGVEGVRVGSVDSMQGQRRTLWFSQRRVKPRRLGLRARRATPQRGAHARQARARGRGSTVTLSNSHHWSARLIASARRGLCC